MRILIPLAAAAIVTVNLSSAHAGGMGIVTNVGAHEERVYYYSPKGEQGIDFQTRPNWGLGAEGVLGDRDDKILGLMRLYMISDSTPNEPDTTGVADAVYPLAHEQPPRKIGALTMGVQWGLLGDPTGLQLVLNTMAGTGFVTTDNLEFLIAEVGVGGTYTLNDRYQLYATAVATARHRKRFSFGPNAYAGARILFD